MLELYLREWGNRRLRIWGRKGRYMGGGSGKKKLPVGIENFEKIRTDGFYYVDKTGLIRDLLYRWGK